MLAIPTVRLAQRSESALIAEMSRDNIEAGLQWSWTQPRVLRAVLDRATNVAVVCQHDRILGFGIMQYSEEWAHLALLAIEGAQRRRGLATRLVAWLEQPALIAGIRRFRVEARADNPEALAFYLRLGFSEAGRVPGYYQGSLDALRLEKNLDLPA